MIKINMGSGKRNFGSDWIHIDGGDYDHLQYRSITDLGHFENNSVDLIYASHVIEYFDREEVVELLTEWKRILKVGGTLRIAVPNFEALAALYLDGSLKLNGCLGPLYGKMEMDDKIIYHKTTYDFESIEAILLSCGFKNCCIYDWKLTDHSNFDDHSQAYIPHMDKENGILISLNVECEK